VYSIKKLKITRVTGLPLSYLIAFSAFKFTPARHVMMMMMMMMRFSNFLAFL